MDLNSKGYDAVVVGSGPNGLAAAITMQQVGLSVLLIEGKDKVGGGLRTSELTLPNFMHDVCSAVHPMAMASPFFSSLPLQQFGLKYINPTYPAAHPLENGDVAVLYRSILETANALGPDKQAYIDLIGPLVKDWDKLVGNILSPLRFPKHPLKLARFGFSALQSATMVAKRFSSQKAQALWGGMAAHAIQPLGNLSTAAIGMVLPAVGHIHGWPIPVGGSQSISFALESYFVSLGGKVQTGFMITDINQLPTAKVTMLDVTPKQLQEIAGDRLSRIYKYQLNNYRYGMGVFKVDWALSDPVPFASQDLRKAGTIHLGNTFKDIELSERQSASGIISRNPFVLMAQPTVFDNTRAPKGKHIAWAYCHVPSGSTIDMTAIIENQIEKFAPGFRETILARKTMNTKELQNYNPNYIGGDINGGILDIRQLYTRPALRLSPYRTSSKGLYLCSSSTPPGGGVHGMCGYYAARQALSDIFDIDLPAVPRKG